jgi:hypothetical protein
MTCEASPNVTSSPASADGPTLLDWLDGPTTAPSGPAPAPASRSRSRAKAEVSTTNGTCGPTSFASSVPAGPLSSWESRLRERLAMVGSTECALIWREKTTPAGASISRLAPWTPPISGSGSTGAPWPTPTSLSFKDSHQPGNCASMNKTMALAFGPWPTPAAADLAGGRTNPPGTSPTGLRPDGTKAQIGLPAAMKDAASTWSTPRASDGEKGGPNQSFGAGGQPLPAQMHGAFWGTPEASDVQKHSENPHTVLRRISKGQQVALNAHMALTDATARSGAEAIGSYATIKSSAGSPNPAFPCWLMGYPPEWLSGADSVTPLSRKKPRK